MLVHWEKISEEVIFRNNHWIYKSDKFSIPGKTIGEYHYVHTNGSTLVIPILPNKNMILVNQYRYLINEETLEFPCGVIEKNLTPEENARKELREETGFDAENIFFIGEFIPYSGVSDEKTFVFIANNLFKSPLPSDETEEFELVNFTIDKFEEMIYSNKIKDGMTLAAWQIAKERIKTLPK